MFYLDQKQLDKLSELFLDLAKGSFLAALAVPVLTGIGIAVLLKFFITGMICVIFSLKLIEKKERQKWPS